MSPRRPRRRARRRSSARPVILLVAAVIVLAFVVGGLTQVSRQSQGYDANSDRTLAAQGTVVADQSNATSADGAQGRQRPAVADPPGVAGDARQRGAADRRRVGHGRTSPPGRPRCGRVATQFTAVFAERAAVHDAAACRRRRVPRHAAHRAGRHARAMPRRPPPVGVPPAVGRRRRRTASPAAGALLARVRRALPLGPALPGRRDRATGGCRRRSG